MPVISLDKVFSVTGLKCQEHKLISDIQLLYASVYIQVQFMLSLEFLIWFFFQILTQTSLRKLKHLLRRNHVLSLETGNKVSPTIYTGVLPAAVVMASKWRLNGSQYPTMWPMYMRGTQKPSQDVHMVLCNKTENG